MMKRIITGMALLLAMVLGVQAQDVKKSRLMVDYFLEADGVSDANSDKVRQAVLDALNKTKRFQLVDQEAKLSVNKELERRTTEEAMADEKARTEITSDAAYDYIMEGNVTACSVKEQVKDGKKMYSCVLNYSVTVTEVATTTTVATRAFEHSPSGLGGTLGKFLDLAESPDKAITSAVNLVENDIEKFVIEEFPLIGTIIPLDFETKKDKLVTCYIDLGSDHGVKEGDFFEISVPTYRAGRATYKSVGRLKVTEVVDGTMSMCKVTKGEKQALTAINAVVELADEAEQKKQALQVKSIVAPLLFGL